MAVIYQGGHRQLRDTKGHSGEGPCLSSSSGRYPLGKDLQKMLSDEAQNTSAAKCGPVPERKPESRGHQMNHSRGSG